MRNEGEDSFYSYISYEKISVGKWRISLWDRPLVISSILVISIVIDSDRGHCYEHLKKKKSIYDENWTHVMYLNVYVCDDFWAPRNGTKVKFWIFQAQAASVRVISSIFCK